MCLGILESFTGVIIAAEGITLSKLMFPGCIIALLSLCACTSTSQLKPGHSIEFTIQEYLPPSSILSAVVTITGSPEDVRKLSSIFESFAVWFGKPKDGIQHARQQDLEEDLILPWGLAIDEFTSGSSEWPPRARLVGKKDGKWVVIKERVFQGP